MPKRKLLKSSKLPAIIAQVASVDSQKLHPWRLFPVGQYWVRTHPLRVPVSRKNANGVTTKPDEIREIAAEYFSTLTGPPSDNELGYLKNKGNPYDALIRGWTKYWNEVFKPEVPLDPDLIKALIGSESSFDPKPPAQNARGAGKARGLIQLTDQTIKILGNTKGELKDHIIHLNKDDALDPNISICAGIRWLFHKKKFASARLKREAT